MLQLLLGIYGCDALTALRELLVDPGSLLSRQSALLITYYTT